MEQVVLSLIILAASLAGLFIAFLRDGGISFTAVALSLTCAWCACQMLRITYREYKEEQKITKK